MPEHELGLTALFNNYLAGVGNAILGIFNLTAKDPARPWENWITVELLVVALLMLATAILRSRLSADKPGTLQHIFEAAYGFVKHTAHEAGVPHAERHVQYFATVFLFILSMNLIGMIPAFESPTMAPWVPAGMALVTFVYYNFMGVRAQGLFKYLAHFAGPVWQIAWLMIPIEIVSHLARPLSLTVRLYGNMFAGEQVTGVFLKLTYVVFPAVFMALHLFVAVVQTYVFTLLTMIYVAMATETTEH